MNERELLEQEKKILYTELKVVRASTRKDEIIDRILEIEKEILRLTWEAIPVGSVSYSTQLS